MAYAQYPPGYNFDFEYRTPPRTSPQGTYQNHRYSSFNTPSPRGTPNVKAHARRTSQEYYSAHVPPQYTSHSTPRRFSQSSPLRPEYVSDFNRMGAKARQRFRDSDGARYRHGASGYPQWSDSKHQHRQSSARYYHNVVVDDDCNYHYDAPPPYEAHPNARYAGADFFGFKDAAFAARASAEPEPERPRTARRPTTSGGRHQSTPKRPSPAKRKATEEDARRAGIPAGYSYKNWDPTEEPITLLGSVFDANSLGKWIYDWTVFRYGPATPFSDIAGDLWLLLIQVAGKVKRADHLMPRIRREDSREMVEDFLESGERLWIRVKKLLKICEEYMWKAAKRSSGEKRPMQMGKDSGCEFVDSLFGRDRELDKTEKLMSAIRLWSLRFDANCEEILRNPAA